MLRTLFTVSLVVAGLVHAQVQVQVNVALPTITFAAPPPLVVVQPGLQVVEDFDDEVFFVEGFYWARRDGRWFRTKNYRGGWVFVERGVPTVLVSVPPGQYRKWKGKPGRGRDDDEGRGRGKGKGKKERD
jgi:hypothetical protein